MKNTANNSQENLREDSLNINNQPVPIHKWSNDKVLEWFMKKFPSYYDSYKNSLTNNQINGQSLLDLNTNCLDQMKIFDRNLRSDIEINFLRFLTLINIWVMF